MDNTLSNTSSATWILKRCRICISTPPTKVIFPFLVILSLLYLMNIQFITIPQNIDTTISSGRFNFTICVLNILTNITLKSNGKEIRQILTFMSLLESGQRENPAITNKTSLANIASRGNDNLFPRKGIVMEIPKCKCSKLIPHPRKQENGFNDFKSRPILVKDTLCEDYTFVRGPGQNIVAFTFYEPPVNVSIT